MTGETMVLRKTTLSDQSLVQFKMSMCFCQATTNFILCLFGWTTSWDQVSKYSGLLMQWKMSPGFPHGALRISNLGDYKLYFRGYHLWEDNGNGKFIGFAKPQAWNDVKFFYKKSMSKDGFVFVWLNGRLVFEHHGPTLLKSTQRGYTKFGQYTEIRDERVVYYDAVEFCHTDENYHACLDAMGYSSLGDWLRQGENAPTVTINQINNQPVAETASMLLGSNMTIDGLRGRSRG